MRACVLFRGVFLMRKERCACTYTAINIAKKCRFKCNTLYRITIAYTRGVMLAISLIGRVNLNNSFEINVSQLYNAVPWLVTYKIDDIFQSGVFYPWIQINALRVCKMINCGWFVLDYKFMFALGERAYSTLPYSEIITAVSFNES